MEREAVMYDLDENVVLKEIVVKAVNLDSGAESSFSIPLKEIAQKDVCIVVDGRQGGRLLYLDVDADIMEVVEELEKLDK